MSYRVDFNVRHVVPRGNTQGFYRRWPLGCPLVKPKWYQKSLYTCSEWEERRGCDHVRKKNVSGLVSVHATPPEKDPVSSAKRDMNRHRRFMVAIDLYSHDSSNREMCRWMMEHMIRPGDDIILVHCIVPLPMQAVYALPDGRLVSNADVLKVLEMQDEIEVQMVAAVNDFKDEVFGGVMGDVDVDVLILNQKELMTLGLSEKGEISDLLCRAAVEYNADALLIASTSRGGITEALTGSVAASAARHSEHVPVVVYRSAKERSPGGQTEEGDGRVFLVPVEDSKASIDATVWLADTVYRHGDVIVLVHIIPSVPFFLVPTMGVSPDTFLLANSLTDEYKEEFSNKVIQDTFEPLLKEREVDYRVEILLELSDGSSQGLGRAILSRADACKADLICIGSQSRGGLSEFFLGSVANYVDHHATMPVVVVH